MFLKYKLISLFLFVLIGQLAHADASDKETKENKLTTTGFLQEITEIKVHHGPERSGQEIYEYRCKGCHARNTQGAPMPDDNFEWSKRLRDKGLDVLLTHSMEGFNNYLMPPKGGCRDCNRKEVYEAVFYMLESSGINTQVLREGMNLDSSVDRSILKLSH